VTAIKSTNLIWQNKSIVIIVLATACVLLVPLVAMQFSDEVVWSWADFVGAGVLLSGAGLTFDVVARRAGEMTYRAATGVAVAAGLLLIWVNLAVGIIGDEGNPANAMYLGVLAVGIIGALIARFEPYGMARALFATAFAQALVPVLALTLGTDHVTSVDAFRSAIGANTLFVVLFVGSGLLFLRAAANGRVSNTP
jgi:hypothetical protein